MISSYMTFRMIFSHRIPTLQRWLLQVPFLFTLAQGMHKAPPRDGHRLLEHRRPEPFRVLLNNSDDVQYVAALQVGGQELSGIMDTGSFELLVFSKACKLCGTQDRLYDPKRSDKHQQGTIDKMHSFGSGDTWSHEAFDEVAMGPLTASNQSFWEVVDTAMPILQSSVFQAIVGLGPPGSAYQLAKQRSETARLERDNMDLGSEVIPAFMDQDLQESIKAAEHAAWKRTFSENLGVRTFSICIGRELGDPGYLIWNDANPEEMPSTFARLDMLGSLHWSVSLSNIRLGGAFTGPDSGDGSFSLGCGTSDDPCAVVLDSGTSLIGAPRGAIDKVASVLDSFNGDCSRVSELPELRFQLAGIDMSLPPESYVGEVSGEVPAALSEILRFRPQRQGLNISAGSHAREGFSCQPLLMSIDGASSTGPTWILGLPFFRKYYTTFQSIPLDESSSRRKSRTEFKNQIFVALADSRCSPAPPSLLLSQPQGRLGRRHLRVDASKLRVPHYVRELVMKKSPYTRRTPS